MRRGPSAAIATLLAGCAALTAGCGSNTKTVSVSGAPPQSAQATSSTSTAGASATAPAQTSSGHSGATGEPSQTRTAPAPAFTHEGTTSAGAGGASGAVAVVRSKGYTASDPGEYHPDQTLRVLVGTRTGSGDGYGQQAFFFVDGSYIGTDASEPSATLKVVSQGDTEVVLAYPLYRPGDPLSHPSGGQTTVRFQLNDGKLVALGKIPPATSQSSLSRQ